MEHRRHSQVEFRRQPQHQPTELRCCRAARAVASRPDPPSFHQARFHRNNVSGLTSRCSWQALDGSGVNAANSPRSAPGRRGLFTWRGARDFMAQHQVSAFSIVNYEQASWAGRTDQVAIPR